MQPLDYLVIAPHPDDAELGVGGTMLLLEEQGARVGVLDLTDGEPTPFGSPEIRRRETEAATEVLGLSWRGNLGLVNRRLEADLAARARLAGVLRELRPAVLFAPYWEDAHPDHVAATALVEAARFWAKLTKTDLPGESLLSATHPLLFQRPPPRPTARPAFVGGRDAALRPQDEGDRVLPLAVHRRPRPDAADRPRRPARPRPLLGLGDRGGVRRTVRVP